MFHAVKQVIDHEQISGQNAGMAIKLEAKLLRGRVDRIPSLLANSSSELMRARPLYDCGLTRLRPNFCRKDFVFECPDTDYSDYSITP